MFAQFYFNNFFLQNYIRVHYKGYGKTPKDASSVRATHPIPASCGLYYYEVKIVSKGRDGYMGIGLSTQIVNTNRLPGWDKMSYGYHGDDGNAFCGSGQGKVVSSRSSRNKSSNQSLPIEFILHKINFDVKSVWRNDSLFNILQNNVI